jgi:hypothetical protein
MDPSLYATPTEQEIAQTLLMWPEVSTRRARPILVTAFGDIYFESDEHDVWRASAAELQFERVAESVPAFDQAMQDTDYLRAVLLVDLVEVATLRGITRQQDEVFSIAPHPNLAPLEAATFVPMSLRIWHHIALQLRPATQQHNA